MKIEQATRSGANNELAGIEILRFLCAFGVLIWHYQHFFFHGEWNRDVGRSLRRTEPLYGALAVFYDNGYLAVPFFWVISGFIFYWYYAESVRSGNVGFTDFAMRRFSRLYPLHFVTLLIVAVAQYFYWRSHGATFIYGWNKPIWFVSHLLFASNWLERQVYTFNGPIWSVSIEILIYLLFFGVARAFGSRVTVALCASVVFAFGFNFLHTFLNSQVFACGMYFFAGGVAQWLSARRGALPVAAGMTITMLVLIVIGKFALTAWLVLPLAASSVICMVKLGESTMRTSFGRLAFLGNATYSSYLIHFPIQLLAVSIMDALGLGRSIFYSPVALLAYLGSVIGAALLVHRYFEMPAQNAIRKALNSFTRRRRMVEKMA
jgi:peptidoglycan/LPS O-acetylase OafA/YrhL